MREREATQQTSESIVTSFTQQGSRRKTDHFWTCWSWCQVGSWIFRLRAQRALGWPRYAGQPWRYERQAQWSCRRWMRRGRWARPGPLDSPASPYTAFPLLWTSRVLENTERWQNMPPQDMLLWHKDYFWAKSTWKKQQMQEGLLISFSSRKQGIKTPLRKLISLY